MNPPSQLDATALAISPVLETLHLYQLTNLIHIWHGPVPMSSFGKLTSLTIERCSAVAEVIRSDRGEDAQMATKTIEFPKLERLVLQHLPSLVGFCYGVDKIHFPKLKELLVQDIDFLSLFPEEFSLPNLEKLELTELQNLETLGNGPLSFVPLSKLKQIDVCYCDKLLYVFSLQLLPMLRDLEKHTVELDGVDASDRKEDAHMATKTIEFPQLEKLVLRKLPSLVGFCRGVDKIHFPKLKELSVRNIGFHSPFPQEVSLPNLEKLELSNLRYLETLGHGPLSFGSLSKLKQINVRDCDKLLSVFPSQLPPMLRDLEKLTEELEWVDASEPNKDISSPVVIRLSNLPKLKYISKRDPVIFKYIQTLEIFECDSLRYVFAPTMTKSIPQLLELKISGCKFLSTIVAKQNGQCESSVDEVEFPQLARLDLKNLPNLVSFFPNVTATPEPLFNEKVAIPSLKYLELHELKNLSNIWFSELPTSSFSELKELEVRTCKNLRNTFHLSMVEALANLEKLVIRNCPKMEAVVDSEEEGPGRKIDKVMFPQLRKMELRTLPNLRTFCQFTRPSDFPVLSEKVIWNCASIDAFSLGDLSFPDVCLPGTSSKEILNHPTRFAEEQDHPVCLPML